MSTLRAQFYQPITDALVRNTWFQVFGDAPTVRQQWLHQFSYLVPVRYQVEQVFNLPDLVRLVLHQDFAIAAAALRAQFHQEFSVKDVELLRREVYQVFQLAGPVGGQRQYTVSVVVDGEQAPNPAKITLERDIDLYYIEAIVTPAIQAHFKLYRHRATVLLSLNGRSYTLMVTTPQRNRAHGGSSYTVELQSPAVQLGEKYADTVSGEYTGFASAIAAELAHGFAVDWQAHDEFYAPGTLIVADQYPIEVIRDLASAGKAVVQSNPDGSLKIVRRRKKRVEQLGECVPDYTLSDVDDFYTVAEEPLRRKKYNAYTVRNQAVSDEGLRVPEVTDISAQVKEVRGYQVPWDGNFDLTHRGGTWAVVEPLGIEERQITEQVIFQDGTGSTDYPIYAWSGISWDQTNLGTITFNEDGSLQSTVAGESLLNITYTTRCKVWRVRDSRTEDLLLVAEEDT